MLFYFVRHGETDANRARVLAGSGADHPLNADGHAQARVLAAALETHIPHRIHRVVSSSMTRTRETAEHLSGALRLPVEIHSGFREWHLGEWEGGSFEQFGSLLLGDGEPSGGESRVAFYARVERAWRDVHSSHEPYLIVAHGGVWMALADVLRIPRFAVRNCHLVRVEGPTWRATVLNERSSR
ncbi:MAG TPA: histidine phosphatase family protein [Bdellovibrionales bacterium]|nr:histidine phosphatase family protein [Bdellovibrionales bacterium]